MQLTVWPHTLHSTHHSRSGLHFQPMSTGEGGGKDKQSIRLSAYTMRLSRLLWKTKGPQYLPADFKSLDILCSYSFDSNLNLICCLPFTNLYWQTITDSILNTFMYQALPRDQISSRWLGAYMRPFGELCIQKQKHLRIHWYQWSVFFFSFFTKLAILKKSKHACSEYCQCTKPSIHWFQVVLLSSEK